MTKDDYRKQTLKDRDSLTAVERQEKSRKIFETLTSMEEYQGADAILIYASMRSEVSTDDLILDSLSDGKRVFCPKVTDKDSGTMEFVRIYSPDDLTEGYFGIREPEITEESEVYKDGDCERPLMIMPGVVFDCEKNRIGYSGGFYDRFREQHSDIKAVAICYELQVFGDVLPVEAHDIKSNMIITEDKIIL